MPRALPAWGIVRIARKAIDLSVTLPVESGTPLSTSVLSQKSVGRASL